MAIVGDGRRLATELVVISASATQEMYATGALVLLVVVSAFPSAAEGVARGEGLSAGASIVLTKASHQSSQSKRRHPRADVDATVIPP
jgi:hypothetical protein